MKIFNENDIDRIYVVKLIIVGIIMFCVCSITITINSYINMQITKFKTQNIKEINCVNEIEKLTNIVNDKDQQLDNLYISLDLLKRKNDELNRIRIKFKNMAREITKDNRN